LIYSVGIGKCICYVWFKPNYIAEASAARAELSYTKLAQIVFRPKFVF